MQPIASHYLVELEECSAALLDDVDLVLGAIRDAARRAGLTVVAEASHRFTPQGLTAVVVLSESHLAIHTWPERRYAAVDLLTCRDGTDAEAACALLVRALGARQHRVRRLRRGPSAADNEP